MKKDTPQNVRTFETIDDETIYLRINQLQKGLLQFTDSTNAERLVREYGSDIRYVAPWKNGWSGTIPTGRWTPGRCSTRSSLRWYGAIRHSRIAWEFCFAKLHGENVWSLRYAQTPELNAQSALSHALAQASHKPLEFALRANSVR